MNTHRTVRVDDYDIGLKVELLPQEQRVSVATSIAWFYVTCAAEGDMVNVSAWHSFIRDIINPHVDFLITGVEPEALGESFWFEAIRQGMVALVEENALRGLIKEQLPSVYQMAQASRAVS